MNGGAVGGLDSGPLVVSAGAAGPATGMVLSLDRDKGSIDRGSCSTFEVQWSCDLGGMAPVFLNQHLRPSISRQEYQPVFGSPGTLRQSIAHAGALANQQQRRAGTMLFVIRFTRPLFRQLSEQEEVG